MARRGAGGISYAPRRRYLTQFSEDSLRMNTIKICDNNHDLPIPLIWTFAFPGAEFWCPVCGLTGGMFGTGEPVPETPALKAKLEEYERLTAAYLRARGSKVCISMMYEGKQTDREDLPEHAVQEFTEIIVAWKGVPEF